MNVSFIRAKEMAMSVETMSSQTNAQRAAAERDVRAMYVRAFGVEPDLATPQSFNEKINWRKLYQRDPRFTLFSDKFAVKDVVSRIVGPRCAPETLWLGSDPAALPFDRLRPPYVIKPTHGWGGHVFVRGEIGGRGPEIVEAMRRLMSINHAAKHREWGYRHIPPRVMVERMIETADGKLPNDYKFYVYHGQVHFINVDIDRYSGHWRTVHDRDWRILPVMLGHPAPAVAPARPARLAEMIAMAEAIGAAFDFVRIDLYDAPAGILFGEATFYPGAGLMAFEPAAWDRIFGAPWKIMGAG
jgi:hypothetical protein